MENRTESLQESFSLLKQNLLNLTDCTVRFGELLSHDNELVEKLKSYRQRHYLEPSFSQIIKKVS